jgi:3-oxoadipate enol-lactonase
MLNHVKTGTGPCVVLSHALGCDLEMWEEVASMLGQPWTVLRYDHRGHGASPAQAGAFTIEDLADDAAALIRAECGVSPVHFVGLSMGGMTAQALAARHPALVSSITIANAACQYDDAARAMWQARIETVRARGTAAISEGALQRWFTDAFLHDEGGGGAQRARRMRAQLESMSPEAYASACAAVAGIDLEAGNARINCPALVIAGSLDAATPPALSETIARSIPGARLESIAAAHLSAVEQPRAFAGLLTRFWSSLP